jgi:hypothetical protein
MQWRPHKACTEPAEVKTVEQYGALVEQVMFHSAAVHYPLRTESLFFPPDEDQRLHVFKIFRGVALYCHTPKRAEEV